MLNKNNLLAALVAFSMVITISSCGGGGGGAAGANVGMGGPENSPEEYADTNEPAVDTENTEVTSTTTPGDEIVILPVVETKLEGSLDTETGDTGLIDAEAVIDGAISDVVIETAADEIASGGGTAGTGESDSTTGTADTSTTDSTTGTVETTSADTAGTDTTIATESSDSEDSGETVSTGEPVISGDTVDALEDDEAVSQSDLDYELDSSQGRWFKETESELFSETDAKRIREQIKALREEIKSILVSHKNSNGAANASDKASEKASDKSAVKGSENTSDKEADKVKIKQLREKIAELRAVIGNGGRVQTGIYTNWANENLFLNIKKGTPGWYRIIIIAKNRGKLPDNYNRFTFNVNDSSNETVAGISVKASDKVYYRGSADIRLDNPSGTKLNLVWTNDAYMKDKYDANVSIKKVILKKIKEPKSKTVNKKRFSGDKFSFMDGRWFFENKSAYTFWSNQIIGYTFKNLEEGVYEVTITDYDSAAMNIKADDKNWNKEKVTMNFAEGDTTLYITWTNDSYKENEYDANFMIKSIQIKKVNKSTLTAFLLRTKPGNKVFILSAFLMLSGLIFGIYLKNKNTKEA